MERQVRSFMSTPQGCFSQAGGFLHIFACIPVFPRKYLYSFPPSSGCLLLFAVCFHFTSDLIQTMWPLPWEERINGQESSYAISIVVNSMVVNFYSSEQFKTQALVLKLDCLCYYTAISHAFSPTQLVSTQIRLRNLHSPSAWERWTTGALGVHRHRCLNLLKISLQHPLWPSDNSTLS